jgi:uncharacterized protein (TIRG00374 family)
MLSICRNLTVMENLAHMSRKRSCVNGRGSTSWFLALLMDTASLILIGLGQPPLFLESFVIQLILAILMMMPLTPGSSGIAEVGATSMYALFIPASVVGIFVVIWRIVLYYFNIALGILSSIIIVRREAKKAE